MILWELLMKLIILHNKKIIFKRIVEIVMIDQKEKNPS